MPSDETQHLNAQFDKIGSFLTTIDALIQEQIKAINNPRHLFSLYRNRETRQLIDDLNSLPDDQATIAVSAIFKKLLPDQDGIPECYNNQSDISHLDLLASALFQLVEEITETLNEPSQTQALRLIARSVPYIKTLPEEIQSDYFVGIGDLCPPSSGYADIKPQSAGTFIQEAFQSIKQLKQDALTVNLTEYGDDPALYPINRLLLRSYTLCLEHRYEEVSILSENKEERIHLVKLFDRLLDECRNDPPVDDGSHPDRLERLNDYLNLLYDDYKEKINRYIPPSDIGFCVITPNGSHPGEPANP